METIISFIWNSIAFLKVRFASLTLGRIRCHRGCIREFWGKTLPWISLVSRNVGVCMSSHLLIFILTSRHEVSFPSADCSPFHCCCNSCSWQWNGLACFWSRESGDWLCYTLRQQQWRQSTLRLHSLFVCHIWGSFHGAHCSIPVNAREWRALDWNALHDQRKEHHKSTDMAVGKFQAWFVFLF